MKSTKWSVATVTFISEESVSFGKCTSKSLSYEMPRCATVKGKEYLIKRIDPNSFGKSKVKFLTFAKDSAVEEIGENAFSNCYLKMIEFPKSVRILNDMSLSVLCDITVDKGNKYLMMNNDKYLYRKYPFQLLKGNRWVKSILIRESVTYVLGFAFHNNIRLTSVRFPPSIKRIGEASFQNCIYIRKVTFAAPSQLEVIEDASFAGTEIKTLTIPAKVRKIGKWAFLTNGSLSQVTFESNKNEISLQSIGPDAFASCLPSLRVFCSENMKAILSQDESLRPFINY